MKTKPLRRCLSAVASAALLMTALPATSMAQAWPDKPIHLLVGFAPGGPTDVVARILSEEIGRNLGQPVIVENKAGAAGNIAAVALTNAASDGYTLLYNTSSIVIAPWVYRSVGFDPLKDFAPISLTAAVPLVLITNPAVPAATPAGRSSCHA